MDRPLKNEGISIYATAASLAFNNGTGNDAGSIFRDVVVPATLQQRGISGRLLLTDHATGRGTSTGLWKTKTDMSATENSDSLPGMVLRIPGDIRAASCQGAR